LSLSLAVSFVDAKQKRPGPQKCGVIEGEVVNESLFYRTNEVVINWLFFVLMLIATEVGFRLGRKFETRTPENVKSQISTVEAAILGILALLLGFTVSMAVSRFEIRKQLVLEEADAIGTSSLRAQLLPAPAGPEIESLLRQYVNIRVQYGTAGNDLARLEDLNRQTARLQTEFWTRTATYAQQDPNPVRVGLLLQSLNQTIDLAKARWMAFQNHLPESVIYVNAAVGLLSAMLVGYSFGVNGRRNIFSMFMLAVSITLVLAVIIDLDRPRSGYIRVSQQPMIDLVQRY
jgi:prepilin signal peptidase PulO-like enzyme (type II secretory pathway)